MFKKLLLLAIVGSSAASYYYYNQNSNQTPMNEHNEIEISLSEQPVTLSDGFDSNLTVHENNEEKSEPVVINSTSDNVITNETEQTAKISDESTPTPTRENDTTTSHEQEKKANTISIDVLGDSSENEPNNTDLAVQVNTEDTEDTKETKEENNQQETVVISQQEQIVSEIKQKFNFPVVLSKKETLTDFRYEEKEKAFTYVIKTSTATIDTNAKNYYIQYACQNTQVKTLFNYSSKVVFAFVNKKSGKTISHISVTPNVCKKSLEQQKATNSKNSDKTNSKNNSKTTAKPKNNTGKTNSKPTSSTNGKNSKKKSGSKNSSSKKK